MLALALLLCTSLGALNCLASPMHGYVAEWQWEQWPLQQPANLSARAPGPRQGASLWRDRQARSWWLFGGRQSSGKVYSDLWRYEAASRRWTRVFPNDDSRAKSNSAGDMRTSLAAAPGGGKKNAATAAGVVLCGRSESKRPEERSLAVYGARSARSDTVWQLELKDRLWTAYVCCCDTTDRSVRHQRSDGSDARDNVLPGSSVAAPPPPPPAIWSAQQLGNKSRSATTPPLPTPTAAAPEQRRNVSDGDLYATEEAEVELVFEATTSTEAAVTSSTEGATTETPTVDCGSDDDEEDVSLLCKGSKRKTPPIPTTKSTQLPTPRVPSDQKFCPDFDSSSASQPIAWCDTNTELLVALDLRGAPLRLWQFDLKTSHWTQHKVGVKNGTLWPGCAENSARHAASGDKVYVVCIPYGTTLPTSTRLVYLLQTSGHADASLRALGQLQVNAAFEEAGGAQLWADESTTVLQAAETREGHTLLVLAYRELLDMWVRVDDGGFLPVENIWRGSALKWFHTFSSPLYHLEISGLPLLMPNPREIQQYWPQERGRFIVRISAPATAAEKPHTPPASAVQPPPLAANSSPHHAAAPSAPNATPAQPPTGRLKALIFFGLSLSIFAAFGAAVFVRRCVTCPPPRRDAEGKCGGGVSAPTPIVRYSAIPDELAYPAA